MAKVRGCEIPIDLYYSVEHNVWLSVDKSIADKNNIVTVGMTSYACSLAGEIVALTTKKVGKWLKQNQSCATVESGKWVGPVKVPMHGEIIEINDVAVRDPSIVNADPYGSGWIARIKPDDWKAESVHLVTGKQALAAIEQKMDDDGFGGC